MEDKQETGLEVLDTFRRTVNIQQENFILFSISKLEYFSVYFVAWCNTIGFSSCDPVHSCIRDQHH